MIVDYLDGPNILTMGANLRERERKKERERDMTEAEDGVKHFKDGGRDLGAKEYSCPLEDFIFILLNYN